LAVTGEDVLAKEVSETSINKTSFSMAPSNLYMPHFLLSKANTIRLSAVEHCYKVTEIVIKQFKNLE